MKGVDQEVLESLHGKSPIKLIGNRDEQDELNKLVSFIEENNQHTKSDKKWHVEMKLWIEEKIIRVHCSRSLKG